MKKVKAILILIAISVLLAGCTSKHTQNQKIVVCCGAGLMKPMNEIIKKFENNTGIKVEVHYGGSGELYGMLSTTGCDVFIPGSYYYTKLAMEKGYVINSTVKNVTLHIPVIAVPTGNPKGIKSLSDLAKPGVKVALGDPKACAIGRVAIKILKKNDLWSKVKKNVVVYAPTVNQLLMYLTTKQVDAAIIWKDLSTWAEARGKVEVITIPAKENIVKTIPIAVTVKAKKEGSLKSSLLFEKYVLNSKKIWEKWGFIPCNQSLS